MTIKEYRTEHNITIMEASKVTNVPLRTYIRYESDESYGNALKRQAIFNALKERFEITETKGLLNVELIKKRCAIVFNKYRDEIEYCYLFGSYAKDYAMENSDVDLCISTTLKGLKFVGLIEELRVVLNKRVDLIRISDLKDNLDLINDIMKDGIKIYG